MEVPSPISLSVVFKAHCMIRFSQRLVHDGECDLPTQCHALWTRCLWGCFENWVPLSESILFGVPCHHKTYFLRPKIMFLVVAWGKGYVSSHLVVSSIIVSTCCLSGRAWGSVIWPICQISPYLYFSHPHPYQRGFKRLACLIAAYFTFMNSLCNSVNGSVQPIYGPIIMSQLFRDALRCHEPIGLFFCQLRFKQAISVVLACPTCWFGFTFFSDPALGYGSICMMQFYNQQLYFAIIQQHRFNSVLSVALFPLLQAPSQEVCHYQWLIIKSWPFFSFSNV